MVRIPGDEASILAMIEVVKVILIAVAVSVLTTLDNVWCMYMLRKHGEVVMYQNDIGHLVSKTFKTIWSFLISVGTNMHSIERKRIVSLRSREELNVPSKVRIHQFSFHRSVRTLLLFASILLSVAEVIALFAITTEGKDVADKPEFDVRFMKAVEVPSGSTMKEFYANNSHVQYEYVIKRLGRTMEFKNGTEFKIQVPRRLDVLQDEKWPYTVHLAKKDVYATVYKRDFVSEEKARFNESIGFVAGLTDSGKQIRDFFFPQRDTIDEPCSEGVGAGIVDNNNSTGILCYTEKLQDKSCADMKNNDTVSFPMYCSKVQVERFGQNLSNPIWWLSEYISGTERRGSESIKQMLFTRAYRRDEVSPSAVIIAALLTEYDSQSSLVERDFAVDVGVVVVPNWLVTTTALLLAVLLLLGGLALAYTATKNLVNLTNWQEMYIANLLDPLDCLNRSSRKEFRCVVSQGWNIGQKYQLFVEPREGVNPVPWVSGKEIGTVDVVTKDPDAWDSRP